MKSQTNYETLRKEIMMMKSVNRIAQYTKYFLIMNYRSANIKKTNPKFRNGLEKFKLMHFGLEKY